MSFQKATKESAKLRLAIAGPSGAGKTYSALRIATGIVEKVGGKIAFIDTENRTACKYADKFDFDVDDSLTNESPIQSFIDVINSASKNYSVLIIDSMSHSWESLLDEVEKVARAKYSGNTFAAWKDKAGGHLQSDFINAILKSKCHIIACFRVKTDWVVEPNEKGKMTPKRVGMAVKQREGIEYEFDMFMEGNVEHFFTITKDRTGKYQDVILEKPSEKFGKELAEWLNDGTPQKEPIALPEEKKSIGQKIMSKEERIQDCKTVESLQKLWDSFESEDKKRLKDIVKKQKEFLLDQERKQKEHQNFLTDAINNLTPENFNTNINEIEKQIELTESKVKGFYIDLLKEKMVKLDVQYEPDILPF